MGRVTARRSVVRVSDGRTVRRPDTLAVEEPLEIRVGGRSFAVTMRTPGHDFDLAVGFLVGEGVVRRTEDVLTARYCAGTAEDGTNTYNVVDVALAEGVAPPSASLERSTYVSSSCGVCGKASLDAVRTVSSYDLAGDDVVLDPDVLVSLPERLREGQQVFDRTGGLHAAGLFDRAGTLLCLREDVGRHNAVDKVVGWALREGRLPLRGHVLQVSGRASFELAQKTVMAGVPVLSAVSAPSSLAVDLAAEAGLTLAGFVRGGSFNLYAGAARVATG
ncbi:MAG: formate dehydrogenase accessory sulfurtransferase FdhD [Actinomycetota bacterium]|nr:formate dehydrogenase accessory sulfurtransferase FdhD [Actinomycetota bacterium]